ncbi:GIY-YIG nuclease family protein [Candidatus Nomurabacteria bacterium]|nr:GIY-YIG nuclease family protein [Candidatus Nomurabacteria bacterium]
MLFCVYLIESVQDKSWYIVYTKNLKVRLKQHNSDLNSSYTRKKRPWNLIYCEFYRNSKDARNREKFLKSCAGRIFLKKQIKNYLNS